MKLILKSKLRNSIGGIDIGTEIEGFHSVILILKPRSWNANGGIDIVTATVEYDFHYRTSNGFLKTSIAHPRSGTTCMPPTHTYVTSK